MKNSGIILVGVVAIAAVALSATTAMKPNYDPVNATAVDAVSCVDYDPPNTADQVTHNGVKFNLIKINAGISEDKVKAEMTKLGVAAGGNADGRDMYKAEGKNYFGEPIGDDFVYVDSGKKNKGMWLFNVYIKDGIVIPDYIRNCTTKGGERQTVDYWRTSQFPPAAFNATDVQGGGSVVNEPAYIYSDRRSTVNELNQRQGVQNAGSLFVQTRNQTYNLRYHLGTIYLIDGNEAYEYIPTQQPVQFSSEAKENLQLKWFYLVDTPVYSWFTPECKPAVYLYPTATQQTAVVVEPKGRLTLTIPEYPVGGWNIVAEPDGTIRSGGETFPYLYYEAEILDSAFNKPTKGYVASFNELDSLYAEVLPKLGLNAQETADFKEYWNKYLPFSPYYFVGVMPVSEVDKIEKLTISPKPDTTIRVRIYFEPLKDRKVVQEPTISDQPRNGFTVVEWGGMVKLQEGKNFTCSQ